MCRRRQKACAACANRVLISAAASTTVTPMAQVVRVFAAALAALAAAALTAGCSGSSGLAARSPRPSVPASAARTTPGQQSPLALTAHSCGSTQLLTGPTPAWIGRATDANTPASLPFAVSDQGNAAGFLFGYPLTAPSRPDMNNKILWVVRTPRDGQPLVITARQVGASRPVVRVQLPADSGPGEIYPSIIDVPAPGCWHFTLQWPHARATVDLRYTAR
jgi:hypothetical protein